MISFYNIFSIAKYEITTLLRSWFFRIFALIAIIFLFFFNMGTLIIDNGNNWTIKAISSAIPYVNLLLLNTVQAIIAIFLASDFLKRDKKLDTTDVIYIRSMSNGEYVAGKTIGNIVVFMILNLIILSEALIFNLIAVDVQVNWLAYLEYFLIISLPTLIFILGLSFFVMSILKNQAITFILLLGYVAITIFYFNTKYYYLFDYMAYSMPLLNSDFIGFGNLHAILIHRGMYTCFGIAFIFLTISLLKRLPQSPFSNKVTLIPAILFFAAGMWLGKMHVSTFVQNRQLRENMRSLNDANQTVQRLKVESYLIDLQHKGNSIEVTAKLKVSNPHPEAINHFVFSLNPGLTISKVKFNGQEIEAKRTFQLIEFSGSKLAPGESAELEFTYSGGINEAGSFLDMDDKTLQEPFRANMFQIDKRSAIVTPEYVLLTRESNWYPIAGTGFGKQSKQWMQKQFSNFEITVTTKPTLTAISQGKVDQKDGVFHFTNKHNLPQISLIIGNYTEKSDTIDGLAFSLYINKKHDYFTKFFEPIKDTIPTLISVALKDYERKIDLYYPFERLTMIEVPAQFYSYQRTLIGEREQIQPETILFPEKGLLIEEADFAGSIKRMEKYGGGRGDQNTTTPEEKKIMAFNNFLSLFTQSAARADVNRSQGEVQVSEKSNPLNFFPLFYNHAYFVQSDQWPITDRIFEAYLRQASESGVQGFQRNMQGMTENEQANLALLDYSFAELLNDPTRIQIIDNVIQLKGLTLFSIIKRNTGDDAFNDFMFNFLKSIKFNSTTIEDFNTRIQQQFGTDLLPYMSKWFNSKELPGYLIGGMKAVNVLDGDRLKTMVKFKITNTEQTEGIVVAQFRLGEGGGPGRGRFGGGGANMETINKLVHLDGKQTKEVSYLLDGTPRNITINTLTSRNIPAELMLPLDNIEIDTKATPYEGENIVDVPVRLAEVGEYISDDEDPSFRCTVSEDKSLLQRILLKEDVTKERFIGFNTFRAPRTWRATTNSGYFGKFIRSAHFVKSGDGSKKATWHIPINGRGTYEVFSYLTKNRRGRRDNQDAPGEYTYTIFSENKEDVMIDLKTIDNGWNSLGTFYFSGDTAKVELSNKTSAQVVVADAIKLVKQ